MASRGTATKKLSRKTDQRAALIRGLARSLALEGSIRTTKTKATALRPFIEKLATKAKEDNLSNRRQIISAIGDVEATDELVARMQGNNRAGGYTRIEKEELRRGDSAQMVTISFVDSYDPNAAAKEEPKPKKEATKKTEDKKTEKEDK